MRGESFTKRQNGRARLTRLALRGIDEKQLHQFQSFIAKTLVECEDSAALWQCIEVAFDALSRFNVELGDCPVCLEPIGLQNQKLAAVWFLFAV